MQDLRAAAGIWRVNGQPGISVARLPGQDPDHSCSVPQGKVFGFMRRSLLNFLEVCEPHWGRATRRAMFETGDRGGLCSP